jgi:hypothetical protein
VHKVEFTCLSRGWLFGLAYKCKDFKVKAPDLAEATLLISWQQCLKDKYGSPKMGGRRLHNAIYAIFADTNKLIATAKKIKHPLNTLQNWLNTPFIGIPKKKASKENPVPVSVPEPDQDAAMEDSVAEITDVINEPTLPPPPVSAPASQDQPHPSILCSCYPNAASSEGVTPRATGPSLIPPPGPLTVYVWNQSLPKNCLSCLIKIWPTSPGCARAQAIHHSGQ